MTMANSNVAGGGTPSDVLAGWQRTLAKVGKSDGEGTFAGRRGKDKVAP
jgi:hypothetical protein